MSKPPVPVRRILWGTDYRQLLYRRIRAQITANDEELFAKPSWSVLSLLPGSRTAEDDVASEVTPEKLRHLLKLSALPPPKSAEDERRMLKTLQSQVYFVKEIQRVDTTDVEPLVAIRDETAAAISEQTINLKTLRPFLDAEEKVGKNGTVRRKKGEGILDPAIENTLTKAGRPRQFDPFEVGAGKEGRQKGQFFFVKKENNKNGTQGVTPAVKAPEQSPSDT